MKKWLLLLPFIYLPFMGHAQVVGPGFVDYVTSAPSGSCSSNSHQRNVMGLGTVYTCQSGTWAQISGGGGSGLTGTLTSGKVPVASGAHTLIDGSLLDTGTTIQELGAAGIGPLSVPGSGSVTSGTNVSTLDVENNAGSTDFSGGFETAGNYFLNVNPSIDRTDFISANTLFLLVPSANAKNFTGPVEGLYDGVNFNGSGTATLINGIDLPVQLSGAGTATEIRGVNAEVASFIGHTLKKSSFYVASIAPSGTLDHSYGLYIEDQTNQGTDPWAIKIIGGKNDLGPQLTTVGSLTSTGTVTAPTYATSGANSAITGTEGTGSTCTAASSVDCLWPDSTAHRWKMNPNNTGAVNLVGIGSAATAGHIATFAANGFDVTDGGAPGATAWSAITNPSGNLSLTMAGNTSTFNTTTANATFFNWKNTTAAIVGTSQGSPVLNLCGRAFHGSADVEDCMTLKELPGNGNDATIAFTIGHTGTSTGAVTTTFPGQVLAPNGTSSLPAFASSSQPASGMFFSGNALEFVAAAGGGVLSLNASDGLQFQANANMGFSSSNSPLAAGNDTNMSRSAAGVMAFGTGTTGSTAGRIKAAGYMSVGTTFTSNAGCTDTSLTGGATVGKFTIGQSTSCTTIITMGNSATAPNGWSCWINDQTGIPAIGFRQTATAATTASFSGTGTSGDVLNFGCMGY